MEPHHHGSKLQKPPQLLPLQEKHVFVVYYINFTLHINEKSNFVIKLLGKNIYLLFELGQEEFHTLSIITAPYLHC